MLSFSAGISKPGNPERTLGDDERTLRLTNRVETSVSERRFRQFVHNWVNILNIAGINIFPLIHHGFVHAAEALLQTASPFKPDGAPHL